MHHSKHESKPQPQPKGVPDDPALAAGIAPSPHPNLARFSAWVSVAAQLGRPVFSLAGTLRALGPSVSSLSEQLEC